MPAGIVQMIFNDHFAAYRSKRILHSRETYAAWCIMTCRSEEQGYHIDACPKGDYQEIVYNCCKHRACPQCGATDTERWLERRKAQALNCPYFHIVFTISHDLQQVTIAYAHRDKHDGVTFKLSAQGFIRRLLDHVPEKGSHVVRSYGLFHPNCGEKLNLARQQLDQGPYVGTLKIPSALELLQRMFPDQKIGRCPHCAARLRTVFIYRGGSVSVWKLAA